MVLLKPFALILSFFIASTVMAIPGGMYEVPDLKEDRVVAAANFALAQVVSSDKSYSFMEAMKDVPAGEAQATIVRAFQQVVAGINYRMVLLVEDKNGSCLGAFGVEVYDQFGTLSVTQWAKETTCSEAYAYIQNNGKFGEAGSEGGN